MNSVSSFLQISAFSCSDSCIWMCFPQCMGSSRVIMYLEALGEGSHSLLQTS